MDDFLMIGTVLKPQGVRGECKILSWAADISRFNTWKVLYMKTVDGFMPVAVKVTRISDGFVFACLDGSSSYGLEVDETGQAEENDYNTDAQNQEIVQGLEMLTDVLQHGTVDTWVFRTASGTLMAPALLSVFPAVDPENKAIDVIRERLEEVAVCS